MKDTVILLGNSPFIKEVEEKIEYVLDRYYSIGINSIIYKYKTNEHIFQDIGVVSTTNLFPDIKTITQSSYDVLVKKENKELYPSFTFDFDINTPEDIITDSKLAWCGFTHDYAISYSIHKGWKNIVLIGAADFMDGAHYTNKYKIFNYSNNLKEHSVRFISDYASKRINIKTCNPSSPLRIEHISIDDLLK